MEVSPKRWVRYNNIFYEVIACYDKRFLGKAIDHQFKLNYKNITKVADTPQELVKEKDLIKERNGRYIEVDNIYKLDNGIVMYESLYGKTIFRDEIIEILTPSSNGYDSQWKKGIE